MKQEIKFCLPKMTVICLVPDEMSLVCPHSSEMEALLQKNSPLRAGHEKIFSVSPSESPEGVFIES